MTKILVTGATGMSGQHVGKQLLEEGHQVRTLAHKEDNRSKALQQLGIEVVYGDLLNVNDARAALKGVKAAYFVYPLQPTIVSASVVFAQAAKEAGVDLVVNMSQLASGPETKSAATLNHWLSEQAFNWSGVPVTHVRATIFSEWLLYIAPVIQSGKIIMPWAADSRYTPVATEDLARAIVAMLENPKAHAGKTYTLVGPEEHSFKEVAAIVGRVLGRDIPYQQMEAGAFVEMLGMGSHTYMREHIKAVTIDLANRVFEVRNDLLEKISGRSPMNIETFVKQCRPALLPA